MIERGDAPEHLFKIRELDFSEDLFAERVAGQWFRLRRLDTRAALTSDQLEAVGTVIGNLDKPQSSVIHDDERAE